MNEIISQTLFWFFFVISVIVHECMHLFTLRLYGYDGVFKRPEGKLRYIAVGVEPIGIKNNVIHAPEAIVVRLAPLPLMIPLMISISFLLFTNTITAIVFGILMVLIGSSMDIKDSVDIYRLWIRGKKPYVWN